METELLMAAASPLITSFVEKSIVPRFEKFLRYIKKEYKTKIDQNNNYFGDYYNRTYERYSIVNTLVFHNSQRLLKEIYVAQRIKRGNQDEYHFSNAFGDSDVFDDNNDSEVIDDSETTIDSFPIELIQKYKRILITDTAGMGKSTIMKRMFIDLIDNGIEGIGIPIYIELNRLNKNRTVLKEIQEGLSSLNEEFDIDLLRDFIINERFIFFLDGYDEIPIADKDEVTKDIQSFISKAGTRNYFILTSRPEKRLKSFGDFQLFKIQPLTEDEAYELLTKYDTSKNKKLSSKLVELLQSGEYDSMEEFLENPLLVSLLFTAYDYNRSIPLEKHRFYGVVFEAYFEKHDNTKPLKSRDKLSGLNYDGFDRVLRRIGYDCLMSIGVKFDRDTFIKAIRDARDFCVNLSFSESDLLEDLLSAVPLFCHERSDYKWVHKSLLEYFAARYISFDAKEDQDAILSYIYNNQRIEDYFNMLEIYYDIDYKGFSKNFILPLCKDYIDFYQSNFFESDLLERELIDQRIGYLFNLSRAFVFFKPNSKSPKMPIRTNITIRSQLKEYGVSDYRIRAVRPLKNGRIYLAISTIGNSNIRALISLLTKKDGKNKLFKSYYRYVPKQINFEPDKVIEINAHTSEDDLSAYKDINNLLTSLTIIHESKMLDYQSCVNIVKRIEKELERNKNTNSFLPIF